MKDRLEVEKKLQKVFREQHALITTTQAVECGLNRQAVARRKAAGRLEQVTRGVWRDRAQPVTEHQQILAAVLSHRTSAFAAGGSAAFLYKIDGYPGGNVSLAVDGDARHTNALASVQRLAGIERRDWRRVDGIPCLSPELTLLTLAKRSTFDRLETDLVAMACKGLLMPSTVMRTVERFSGSGRNGIALLRSVAEHWDGERLPGSPKELELGRLLEALGFGPVEYQRPVEVSPGVTLHADIGLPGRPIVVEYQSDAHHSTRKARRTDSSRSLRMRATGIEVLPATQDDIANGARDLVAAIEAIDRGRVA